VDENDALLIAGFNFEGQLAAALEISRQAFEI
ncbi:DUF1806 family protein, partial [Staphylococcus equorum]